MTDIFKKIQKQHELELPFVVFCKPNSEIIVGLFQKNNILHFLENFEEKGFVFAPFEGEKCPYIPENKSEVCIEKKAIYDFNFQNEKVFPVNEIARHDFENVVQNGLETIRAGVFQKVVLSRKETIEIQDFDIEKVFKSLLFNYPGAFNYCFFHPKIGLWLGATPEQFVKILDNKFQTVSLAGTQVFKGTENVFWETKEKKEQHIVTQFITENSKAYSNTINVSEPYTVKAGDLLHIKTDISGTLKSKENLKQLLLSLHPTPAVCGLPKQESKDFILKNEGYDREYYSGFLGELNIDFATFQSGQSDLFVNLRCMKIENNTAHLFVGCGVTSDSVPSNEFQETVNKSMTMKKVL